MECKSRKSRNTWSNRQFGLGVQNETGQRLIEFCQENALVIANTLFQQHKRRLYTWTSPDGWHRNQIDYILCSQRWRSSIQSEKTRPGADCGSDWIIAKLFWQMIAKFRLNLCQIAKFAKFAKFRLTAKFRLKLKKVEKTTRQFKYDLIKSLMTIWWKWEIELRD